MDLAGTMCVGYVKESACGGCRDAAGGLFVTEKWKFQERVQASVEGEKSMCWTCNCGQRGSLHWIAAEARTDDGKCAVGDDSGRGLF